jgi:hypothetical protein
MQFIAYMLLSRYLHLYYYSRSIKNNFLRKKKKKNPYLPTLTWLGGSGLGKQTIFKFWSNGYGNNQD